MVWHPGLKWWSGFCPGDGWRGALEADISTLYTGQRSPWSPPPLSVLNVTGLPLLSNTHLHTDTLSSSRCALVEMLGCPVGSEASLYCRFLLGTWPEPQWCTATRSHTSTRTHSQQQLAYLRGRDWLQTSVAHFSGSGSSAVCVSCQIPNIETLNEEGGR